jgi:hypothetical protein
VQTQSTTTPLTPIRIPPESVVLDIFFVRFPFGDEASNGALWEEIDEQHFPTELRRELARNGFRAGLVGMQMPVALSRLLNLTDEPFESLEATEVQGDQLGSDPTVTGWHSQCRAGRRLEVVASEVYPELPVLVSDEHGLCGRSYPQAQGIVAVTPYPEPDGRVRLELAPELHYGQTRQHPVPAQGGFRLEMQRPRRAFEKLTFSATLTPGQFVVISSLPDRPGSLGHHFLTHVASGQRQQKLLLIRLSQTQHDDLVAPVQVIPLDGLEE